MRALLARLKRCNKFNVNVLNVLLAALSVLLLCCVRHGECAVTLESPCPSVLQYQEIQNLADGAWTAEIQLATEDDLQGVWLHVVLDRKAQSLLNWFGESTTLDNVEYAIRKPEYKLIAGPSIVVKIRANYNAAEAPPLVQRLRLNGRTICATDAATRTTPTPKPFVSVNKPVIVVGATDVEIDDGLIPSELTTPRSLARKKAPVRKPAQAEQAKPAATTPKNPDANKNPNDEQEDFFGGDLSQLLSSSKKVGPLTRAGAGLPPALDVPCGVAVKRVVPLITNGKASIEGAWPWHIALYTLNVLQLKYNCGGSLLTRHHVLTAAHCVARPRTPFASDADSFLVHLGRTQLTRFNHGLQQRQVASILIHPHYNHTNYRNDLAILTLSAPADYTDYVRPICLTADAPTRDLTHELGTVVGWGFDQFNNITELLHETQMPVVDLLTCIYSEPEVYAKLTSTNNFCAGFKNGTSVCNGDSGGGMFFERDAPGEDAGQRWEIRGMVSFSVASRNDICNPHAYAVFTDVLKFKGWIEQNTKPPTADEPLEK